MFALMLTSPPDDDKQISGVVARPLVALTFQNGPSKLTVHHLAASPRLRLRALRMPISVTCPGCKATFNVSDKFAGKQGPCPKCKTVISIPKLDAAKPKEEVKIFGPDEGPPGAAGAPGQKTATGRPTFKPLERQNLKLTPLLGGSVVAAIIVMFALAYFLGTYVMSPYPLSDEQLLVPDLTNAYDSQMTRAYIIRGIALLLVGLPIVWAGYMVLRDEELEPFRGRSLAVRVAICLGVYLLLWGVYAVIPADYTSAWYMWMVMGPPFLLVGFVTAYLCFEFDPTSAFVHFLFFVIVSLLLGMTAGLTMPWHDEPRTLRPVYSSGEGGQLPIYDAYGQPLNDAARAEEAKKAGTKPTATGS